MGPQALGDQLKRKDGKKPDQWSLIGTYGGKNAPDLNDQNCLRKAHTRIDHLRGSNVDEGEEEGPRFVKSGPSEGATPAASKGEKGSTIASRENVRTNTTIPTTKSQYKPTRKIASLASLPVRKSNMEKREKVSRRGPKGGV